jgi:endonuclease/exonuclease/phosphatase family metal-dependent hydrolase
LLEQTAAVQGDESGATTVARPCLSNERRMTSTLTGFSRPVPKQDHDAGATTRLKVMSWNLLRLIGAGVHDVAALVEQYRPDLFLMQEATPDMAALTEMVGGHFVREPMHRRVYGLAAWSPRPLSPSHALPLPASSMPGRVPPRIAQILRVGGVRFANVHLSHGQFLNRWQLLHIVRSLHGPAAIIGDYNAVGPILLAGFEDIGPRRSTVSAGNIISLRVDRCMARGLTCASADVLARGPSDHHPIMLDLRVVSRAAHAPRADAPRARRIGTAGPN